MKIKHEIMEKNACLKVMIITLVNLLIFTKKLKPATGIVSVFLKM